MASVYFAKYPQFISIARITSKNVPLNATFIVLYGISDNWKQQSTKH